MKSDLAVETRAVCMVLIEEIFEVFDYKKEIEKNVFSMTSFDKSKKAVQNVEIRGKGSKEE